MKIGSMIYARVDAMNIVDFARVSEECGFESVWQADHTHRPVTEVERPLLKQGTLHDHAFLEDQWVVLGAMAAVTSQVKLGTAITLVMQRDPIVLAKEVATVDQISGGRVILGVGFGHQRSPYVKEMLNHGTTRETRFDVVRERVLAMREIWTKEEAEFHGKHVNFDPIWSFPKPQQQPCPPVLLGSSGGRFRKHWERRLGWLLDYCDGWLPTSREPELAARVQELQSMARERGRPTYDVTVLFLDPLDEAAIARMENAGVNRIIYFPPCAPAEVLVPQLQQYGKLAQKYS